MMPAVIVFDLNGTLLDTEALAAPIRRIFGRNLSVDEWFTKVLLYSMATSLAGDYRPFNEIAVAVLEMGAAGQGVPLRADDIENVKNGMERLPPFPEVKKALRRLRETGFRLAVLTNSSRASLEEQLRHSGLAEYFEQAISVDTVRRYKPARDTYRAAAYLLGIDVHNVLMVAAHPWDLLGATRAGCRTALLTRPGKALFPGAPMPDYVAGSLQELMERLITKGGSPAEPERGHTGRWVTLAGCGVAAGVLGGALARRLQAGSKS